MGCEFVSIFTEESGSISGCSTQGPRCRTCQREPILPFRYGAISLRIEGIRTWPVFIGNFTGIGIVSQEMRVWLEGKVDSGAIAFHPVPDIIATGAAVKKSRSAYYALEPLSSIEVEIPAEEFNQCPECGIYTKKKFGALKAPLVVKSRSWDGSPIVTIGNLYPSRTFWLRSLLDEFRTDVSKDVKSGGERFILHGGAGKGPIPVPEKEARLVKPPFDLGSQPIPPLIRYLLDDPEVASKMPYRVRISHEIGGTRSLVVARLTPISISSFIGYEKCAGLFEFAENIGDGGAVYLVDPSAPNPNVMVYYADVAELDDTGVTLSDFVKPLLS